MTSLAAELARVGLTSLAHVRTVHVTQPGDGAQDAARLADGAADLVVVDADPGPGALPALALLLDVEPVSVVGTVAGPDWAAQVVAVRNGLRRVRPHLGDYPSLLDRLEDPVLTRTAALVGGLAERRTPVLLGSSVTVLTAALLARWHEPAATRWWLVSAAPDDVAGPLALSALGLPALLDLGLGPHASRYALAVLHEALADA